MSQNPLSGLVDKWYEMDPKEEDVFLSSDLLNGMEVLIEDPGCRQDLKDIKYEARSTTNGPVMNVDPDVLSRARMTNRWCRVSRIEHAHDHIKFIAVYKDEVKRVRVNDLSTGWIVKLNSIPEV